jgi:pyruvate/2-oxoglutarate dehydrogenase complex dihydrolipoamide acyltransferase (E2) component
MHPKNFDAQGLVSGRIVREGEVIGQVGNYNRRQGGTTYHLHFDIQVPTAHGWVFVNPYMTLVAAYERLIHGRGEELKTEPRVATAAVPTVAAAEPAVPTVAASEKNEKAVQSARNRRIAAIAKARRDARKKKLAAANCKTRLSARARRRFCDDRVASAGPRGRQVHNIRKMGRHFSRKGGRARNIRSHLRSRHARAKARHRRF